MGLDVTFYHLERKMNQEDLMEVNNTDGIDFNCDIETFSGRSNGFILDSLQDDLKERYGERCFDNYVQLERKDVEKLVLENVQYIANDEYQIYTSVLAFLMNVLDQVDFDEETFFMRVST